MTTFYRCQPGWPTTQIVLLLMQNGLSPAVIGEGVTENIVVMGGSGVTVEVAVPDEQVEAATQLIQRFENSRAIAAQRHARQFRTHLLIALFVGSGLAIIVNLLVFPFLSFNFAAIFGEAALIALVVLLVLGRAGKRADPTGEFGPSCPRCDYPLIGLPEPRCPECGMEFDADFFEKLPAPPDNIR